VDTGQHYDKELYDDIYSSLKFEKPNINLEVGSSSHAIQTATMMMKIEKILLCKEFDVVIVIGDTNTTLAGALTASKMNIPVCHLEAGLRTNDLAMPEELNRIIADNVSDILFVPTTHALRTLLGESFADERLEMLGDTSYDTILHAHDLYDPTLDLIAQDIPQKYFLATIHRPRNTDAIESLKKILFLFNTLCEPVILPLHPRTRQAMVQFGLNDKEYPNIQFIQPVDYMQMFSLMKGCLAILTDSGGIQKEAYMHKKQCFTLFPSTSWVETLLSGANILVDITNDNSIKTVLNTGIELSEGKSLDEKIFQQKLFGDGQATDKIIECIEKRYGETK
ncbi:hypothetical protein LCGC14_2463410, partial [marine sediment metagenome]